MASPALVTYRLCVCNITGDSLTVVSELVHTTTPTRAQVHSPHQQTGAASVSARDRTATVARLQSWVPTLSIPETHQPGRLQCRGRKHEAAITRRNAQGTWQQMDAPHGPAAVLSTEWHPPSIFPCRQNWKQWSVGLPLEGHCPRQRPCCRFECARPKRSTMSEWACSVLLSSLLLSVGAELVLVYNTGNEEVIRCRQVRPC